MSVQSKMLEVMKNVKYMKKDGKVDFGNTHYKAMTEEKVTSLMRQAMVEQGLIVFPIEQTWTRQGNIAHVDVKYRIVDTENPEDFVEVVSCGDGQDTQDKGAGKAMTYAFKYMWLRTFAIPTGEDPDQISNEEIEQKEKEAEEEAARKAEAQSEYATKAEMNVIKSVCKKKGKSFAGWLQQIGKDEERVSGEEAGKMLRYLNELPDKETK